MREQACAQISLIGMTGGHKVGRPLMRRLLLSLAFSAIAVLNGAIPLASANSSSSSAAVLEDCLPRVVLVPGVEELVRERVPAQFRLVRDPLGRPLMAVAGDRCERWTVNGTTRATNFGFFAAIIEAPDGVGCLSRWPVIGGVSPDLLPVCNFYNLFGVFDNRVAVKWFRSFVSDFPAYYVRKLVFEQEDPDLTTLGAPFRFRAGPRAPSPFKLDAIVREGPVAGPATLSFWFTGSLGTTTFREQIDDFAPGTMDARLRVAPGSEMAKLLGTENPKPIAGLAARFHHDEATFHGP